MTPNEIRAAVERMRADASERADKAMAAYIHAFADHRFDEAATEGKLADLWLAKRETLELVCALFGEMTDTAHPLTRREVAYDRREQARERAS